MLSREVKLVRQGMLDREDIVLGKELSLTLPPNAWDIGQAMVYVSGHNDGYKQTRMIQVNSYEEVAAAFRRAVEFCKTHTELERKEIHINWRSYEYFEVYHDHYRVVDIYDGEGL